MRVIFFGSDDFAATCLKQLNTIVGCVTQPDTRQGRGMRLALSPIREIALEKGIPCFQPSSLKEESLIQQLKALQADIFVVVAYGKILTQEVLNIPKIFCVNVHGSLLPKYRGAAPINWAILNGENQTGVTIQKMALGLDAGDIINQQMVTIGPQETSIQLRDRMAQAGVELLVRTLNEIDVGKYRLIPQQESQVTYAPKLTKEMGRIDWNKSAQEIHNQIRGLQPWPGAFTHYEGKLLKILEAQPSQPPGLRRAGSLVDIGKQGIVIACGQGGLLVKRLQLEAGKPVSAYDFIQGHRLTLADHFSAC